MLGSPIAHSLSPVLHRAAYAALGLDWDYEAVECAEPSLATELTRLAGADRPPYAGVSLTMPLKQAALALVDEVEPLAAALGAVNTVAFEEPGSVGNGSPTRRMMGHNTDVTGLVTAVEEAGFAAGLPALAILGGGGTARAAIGAAARMGASDCHVLIRNATAGPALVAVGERVGVRVRPAPWPRTIHDVPQVPLVVATTPAGATDALAASGWPGDVALVDVLYAPWPTTLAEAARRAGATVVGGLAVLVGQAVEAVALMSGLVPPAEPMRAAGEHALSRR